MNQQHNPFTDISVEDGENSFGSNAAGIKEIALNLFQKSCFEGSKEMVKGGTVTKFVSGKFVEVDVPNQREVFINSVRVLHYVLLPELTRNEELLKEMQEIDNEVKEIEKKKYDELKAFEVKYNQNNNLDWNKKVDKLEAELEMLKVERTYRKLIVLSMLLKEINYFSEQGGSN